LLREAADLACRVSGKAHGLANHFGRSRHDTIVHQNGAARSSVCGERCPRRSGRDPDESVQEKSSTLKIGGLSAAAPSWLPAGLTVDAGHSQS
jgi:hypothetical protein